MAAHCDHNPSQSAKKPSSEVFSAGYPLNAAPPFPPFIKVLCMFHSNTANNNKNPPNLKGIFQFMNNFTPYEESGSMKKSKKPNRGIICDVKNCLYHDGIGKCMAEQIAVGPTYATSSSDTVCATFRPKSDILQ